ncbi:protein FAM149B1-like isoform X2 [Mercenaria mercenaria]|uniref:protein FAM149B1-like isoform X2 n=1 Tax=Mercenaria mercenaria TaxID=6596 RepID=UPI00234F34AB|nr:protein FAM149B1-like isoform X2 [Mercenaria mercenaria]
MGTEVASRPPLPPGLNVGSNSQGPGPGRKKREREQSFSSSGSINAVPQRIYSRDYQLRIQGQKYNLATAFVCMGAKIHQRFSPSQDETQRYSQGSHLTFEEFSSQNVPKKVQNQNSLVRRNKDFSQDLLRKKYGHSPESSNFDVEVAEYNHRKSDSLDLCLNYLESQDILNYSKIHPRRGLSRVTLEEHPTSSLEIVDHQSLPQDFSNKIVEAISNFQETPLSSNRSSPTITEGEIASSSPSIVQGDIWGTGNTTERSSVDSQYSWDEFDRQAAKTVQNLFDEIDAVLYERRNQAEYIFKECQEWGSLFPHLRVLGRQLLPVQESGYEVIERELSRPNTTSSMGLMDITDQDLSGSQDSQGLSVSGRHVRAIVPPVEARSRNSGTPSTHLSEFSFLEEEVYDAEGEYEEIIAVDYKDIYEDHHENKKQLTPRRRRVAYPPITPNACFKDSVASSAFDCMWQEIISWIRPLLKKYSIIVLDDSKRRNQSNQISQLLKNASTPGPPSRENSQIRYNPLGTRAHTMIALERPIESPKLDGVLQISQKIPIHRETSKILSDVSEQQMSVPLARPVSSIPTVRRPGSVRYLAGGRGRGNVRLAPISHDNRSKTPSVDEERIGVHNPLLVRKIIPPGLQGRLSSPLYNSRNGAALPPIGTPMELEPNVRLQKKLVSSRASSAVDKDIRVAFKDRFISAQDTRPSTTHAFRSETPQGMARRASTPFNNSVAFNNSSSSRNPNFGPMHLDIRGNGLQPSQDLGHLGNIPPEILEDPEGIEETVRANQWSKGFAVSPIRYTSAPQFLYYKQRSFDT